MRTDVVDPEKGGAPKDVGDEVSDPIVKARRAVIGKSFETLTLGKRTFSDVTVLDIDDGFIILSHNGVTEKVPWSDVPESVRDSWGYRPDSGSAIVERLLPTKSAEEGKPESTAVSEIPATTVISEDPKEIARELAMKRHMLEAQRKGIELLESDLSKHTIQLNSLRSQLQSVRVLQSNQGGGIRVERVNGESTLVDRRQQARELEAQIRVEEQLVDQFSQSLEKAREGYVSLSREIARLSRAQ